MFIKRYRVDNLYTDILKIRGGLIRSELNECEDKNEGQNE